MGHIKYSVYLLSVVDYDVDYDVDHDDAVAIVVDNDDNYNYYDDNNDDNNNSDNKDNIHNKYFYIFYIRIIANPNIFCDEKQTAFKCMIIIYRCDFNINSMLNICDFNINLLNRIAVYS